MLRFNRIASGIDQHLLKHLCVAQCIAIMWFILAILTSELFSAYLWFDQRHIFMVVPDHIANPYEVGGYINPPWTAIILLPFSLLPIHLSVFLQLSILFTTIAAIIWKYEGSLKTTILTMTSFIAFDNAIELNIGWIVNVGILLPVALSAVLIPIKPQIAMGYYLTRSIKEMMIATASFTLLLIVSFVVWGFWPIDAYHSAQNTEVLRIINIAPTAHISWIASVILGVCILVHGIRKSDPIWIMISWLFFVPYIALYSLLLYFALFAIRRFRAAMIISIAMWVIYSGAILLSLL